MSLSLPLLVMLLAYSMNASHFYGTVMTYHPKEICDTRCQIAVVLRYKLNYERCIFRDTWDCFDSDCGYRSPVVVTTISENQGEWCHLEGVMTHLVDRNAVFQLSLRGGVWLANKNRVVSWKAVTRVDLRSRSDTNNANRSPQTTILPALRIPSNCQRSFSLLAFDPDGDEVKCRFGESTLNECSDCAKPPVLSLSSSCRLQFNSTNSSSEGAYVVQLVMEDFPLRTINLTEMNGEPVTKTTEDSLSKIPVQFAFKVDQAVSTCTEGKLLPQFVNPTPTNGALLKAFVNQVLTITVQAEASSSRIDQLLLSGPSNVSVSSTGGQFILTWSPTEDQGEESHPICFVVQARDPSNTTKYHSDLRCIIVKVEKEQLPATTTETVTASPTPEPFTNEKSPDTTTEVATATPTTDQSKNIQIHLRLKISSATELSQDSIREMLTQLSKQLMLTSSLSLNSVQRKLSSRLKTL